MICQLLLAMKLRSTSSALKFLRIEMPIDVILHVACSSEPFAAKSATIRFFAGVGLQMVVEAGLVAHDPPAVLVWALKPS